MTKTPLFNSKVWSGFRFQTVVTPPPSISINIDPNATLTLQHAVSKDTFQTGVANATQSRTIDFQRTGSMTFTGGDLVIRKENYFATDSSYSDPTQQCFIRGGDGDERSELIFDNHSVVFEGDVRSGFLISGKERTLTFNNGFTMTIDRSESLNAEKALTGASIQTGALLKVFNDSVTTITAGVNDRTMYGLSFIGGGVELTGMHQFILDAGVSEKMETIYGIYARLNNDNKNISVDGVLDFDLSGGITSKANIYGLYVSNHDLSITQLNLDAKQSKQVIGIMSSQGSDYKIGHVTSHITDAKNVWAIYGTGGSIKIEDAELINSNIAASNYGIRAKNTIVTVTNSLSVDATNAVSAAAGAHIDIKKNFETLSDAWIGAGDGGVVKVNSSGTGTVNFTGGTDNKAGSAAGVIEMTLGGSKELSSWNVTKESTLDRLVLGENARLNFFITPAIDGSAIVNGTESVISVSGNQAVTLSDDARSGISLVIDGIEFKEGDEIGLVSSEAGFRLANGEKLVQGANLNSLKQDLTVQKIESLVRIAQSEVKADQYDLVLETDNRLVADILSTTSSTDVVNGQTDALMESSLSAYGTLFAADDLFVDTVLRSRNGTNREGLFATARAGRWSLDTRGDTDMNIVSGLVGYAASFDRMEAGAFIEMGHSSYGLDSSVAAGSGKHNYGGVGLYANYAFAVPGWKLTGYVKGGALSNHFDAELAGQNTEFDRTSAYWGAHLGTHYDFTVSKLRARAFVSYFYDGRESEDFDATSNADVRGAHFKFDSLNAHRIQIGGLFEYSYSPTLRPYFGATLENVLRAKANGTGRDSKGTLDLRSCDLEGTTGILTAGWTYVNPAESFEFDIGVTGYAGVRQGFSGEAAARWRF